jgi:hypothetical protein
VTEPIHERRPLANRAWCDEDDQRLFADHEHATCEACRVARERDAEEWFRELEAKRLARLTPDDDEAPTQPGRARR